MARTLLTAIMAKVTATIAEEHTSVLQALHVRGIRLGETIDHRHSHTQIFLEESLHRVINNQSRVEDLPNETARSFILTMAEDVQMEASSLKTSAQTRITAAERRLAQCNADADLDKCCTNKESVVTDKRQAHWDCRTEQVSSKSTMDTSCGEASTLAGAAFATMKGHCSDETTDTKIIQRYINTVSAHKPALDDAIETCGNDSATHGDANTGKVQECNSKQVAFERAFCQLKTELEKECTTLATCHSDAKSVADDEHRSTKTDEQHFKSLWTVGATIRCLIELVSTVTGGVNITNVEVAACGNQTPPDNLTVQYQNLTTWEVQEPCNAADKGLFPDEIGFRATEYSSTSHAYSPDVDTSQCSGTTTASSTTPWPSSTTPWPSSTTP